MLRPTLVLALLAVTALAGCTGGHDSAPIDDTTNAADKGVKATKTTGVIRGVVVDATITPVADVTVRIDALDKETVTLADGSFAFGELDPATYFLAISKQGYFPVQSQATVVAGVDKPDVLTIRIEVDQGAVANYYTNKWEGHLRCGVMALVATFPCAVIRGTEDDLGDYGTEWLTFEALPTFLQSELQWTNSQELGESLFYDYAICCENENFAANGSAQGPSPLVVSATHDEMVAGGILEAGLEIRVFGGAYPGTETGVCLPPTPATNPFCPWGVGVQVEQPIVSYTSYFYNFLPPQGWAYGADGDPAIP